MRSRSSRFVLASAWLLAALGAVPTGAQQPVTPAWFRARLEGRLDKHTLPTVERIVDSAFARGIPAEPLVDRALEGAAKGAPGEAIIREVRKLVVDLAIAREKLGPQSFAGELSAAAMALRGGVDPDVLARLRRERPGQPVSVPLGVLSGLIANGVPVSTATESIFALTKNGIADEQLVAFRRDVERDVGMGAAPAAAALLHASEFSASFARDQSSGPPTGAGAGAPTGKRRP
ncbi:hypothetical protein J421_4539 [Gemmatirosa kalamazoonensis]|uniref:DUF1400 domain-containing protein n=1 Tax=Gemmatirosa kalamazoonensis TaxID=861299 RepID=W0RMR7_9BACT|nr:hypothetical protein [Gemmatirosa kalamazoonensis]AHG92076.1 hypothetical protein J421_4539 [Gemmatirosa kalamazoonensis]